MLRRLPITNYFFLAACLLLSCTPTPTPTHEPRSTLFVYRFEPPAFIEYSEDFQPVRELPFHLPPDCGLYNTFPAPVGSFLLIELSCPGGQTVLFLDTQTDSVTQPVTNADAHFLAWTSDGTAAYLKVDSLGNPNVVRVTTEGEIDPLDINEFTYDLAVNPVNDDLIFTDSRGLGYGSELHSTQYEVRNTKTLYTDPYSYISFARFSPDGEQIAFIKIPDTPTPFTVGELWVMAADGANPRKLADADAGHGFAANWSPDGARLAFVVRENPEDEAANQASEALISNLYLIEVASGQLTQVTQYETGHVETPFWSPEGNTLAFNAVIDGRMTVVYAELASGAIQVLETGPACCPAWLRR